MKPYVRFFVLVFLMSAVFQVKAQSESATAKNIDPLILTVLGIEDSASEPADSTAVSPLMIDSTIVVDDLLFPRRFFGPLVYTGYTAADSADIFGMHRSDNNSVMHWINRQKRLDAVMTQMRNSVFFGNPMKVRYNESLLPEPPKAYKATVDPSKAQIKIVESDVAVNNVTDAPAKVAIDRIHWLRKFDASLQFSQAYNSPNWYQGGNNNLNMILNTAYNVKLNQKYHPNILFDNTFRYKLALNNAPDDSLRSYSISEDLFQINSNFGIKAARSWYYSVTAMFKTQLLNNYRANTRTMKAAFLSPGEFNVGLGMTYSYTNKKKTISTNLSVAPLSYNLKICTNPDVDETRYGIEEGHTTAHQYGSNAEGKLSWKLAYNINYSSRMFIFTDYSYLQADWENTLEFEINRFLSTRLFVHMRYDTQTPYVEDSKWHKFQLKEILSLGFSYKFGNS